MVMGDFNSKLGADSSSTVVGPFGLGDANEAGERLRDFCGEFDLFVTNTWFQQHPRRLFTWTSPDGQAKNQIDFIMIAHRWRSSVKNCKTFPGADCDSDHQLLVATVRIQLTKEKQQKKLQRLNVEELTGSKAEQYAENVSNRFQALAALSNYDGEKPPDELWQERKEVLLKAAEETVGFVKAARRKEWISDEAFLKIEEKRVAKKTNLQRHKELKADVQRLVKRDKQKQLDDICAELEAASEKGNSRRLFQATKELTRKFQPRLHCIQSLSGKNITEPDKIAERWKEYCEDLYSDSEGTDSQQADSYEREPPPLRTEVLRAMNQTASHKSPGSDDIPAELFKAGGDATVDRMHRICTALWETGEWPDDWTNSIFIPLPKKGDLRQCSNYRMIALVSHASKILLRIILERIRDKTEQEIAAEQAGFRRGRGTRDQVTNLRIIMQKARERQQPLYMCFVDFRKAFDSISHEKLWITMLEMGYPPHLVNLLSKLYRKQRARVRVASTVSEWFKVRKGVRQGCVLSPYLFNILAEMVMRETLDGFDGGFRIGGRRITDLRYADDIVLIANSPQELQELVSRLDKISRKFGLEINVNKTKVMASNGTTCNVYIQNELLQQVDKFPYLGSIITEDANCEADIRARLNKGQAIISSLKKIWKSHGISIATKVRLLKALAWPVAMYGCEGWTIKKSDEARIKAFEMKGLRQILRVSWVTKRTNEWVLCKVGLERSFLELIKTRKLAYFGHVLRKPGDCLEKTIIQGINPGTRGRGRPRMMWIDNIKDWTARTSGQLVRDVEDRTLWRATVHGAANPRNEDG